MKAYLSIGKAFWLACCIRPSLAISVPYQDGFTIGQGYNTFLGQALLHHAVMITSEQDAKTINNRFERRCDKHSTCDQNPTGMFDFTEPGPVMPGLNLSEYFTTTTPEETAKIIKEAAKALSDREERVKATNVIFHEKATIEECQAETRSHIEFISDYTSYLQVIGVNAASTISGYGQDASISGSYLDKSAFSSNSLTFVALISTKKQHRVFNETFVFNSEFYKNNKRPFPTTYGNRWIRGFARGGKLIIRITLTIDESSNQDEVKAAAEASFGFWGATGQLSTEVKNNLENLSNQAKVMVNIFYQGDIGRQLQHLSGPSGAQSSAQQTFETAKSWADAFLETACDHDYRYETFLEEYSNVGNFPQNQPMPHYTRAGAVAYAVLGEMVKHTELRKTLENREALNREEIREIQMHEMQLISAQKNWTRDTALDPDNAGKAVETLFKLSDDYYKKWTPRLSTEPFQFKVKAFGHLESVKDPDTKAITTYDCSKWYEWYGEGDWTWSKVRFCLPTQTDVFRLTVLRERSQYYWGLAWYNEKEHHPSHITVGVDLSKIDSKPRAWKFTSGETTRRSFNIAAQKEKLLPGRYKIQANFYQVGPFWDSTLGRVVEFEITVSETS